MNSIFRAGEKDFQLLSEIATTSFLDSHGHSAKPADIAAYVAEKYNTGAFKEELKDPKNIYHLYYHSGRAAGYSKIVFNAPYPGSEIENVGKLERFYLLKEFHNLRLGTSLLQFNIELLKRNNQCGVWLYVWKQNDKAINFYKKNGFLVIGSHDFKISETHSNPNHLMLLRF